MASDQLKFEIDKALANTTLARTLGNFCAAYPEGRAKSYVGVDFEKEREGVKEVKTYSAEHIDEMIENFTANATLAPETPISAVWNFCLITLRAVLTSSAMIGSFFSFV